jgi:hypothetical protein
MIREVFNGCGSSFLPGTRKSAGARHTVAWYGETRLRKTCRAVGLAKAEAYVAASFMVLLKQIARARQSGATAAVRPSFRCNAQRYTPDCEPCAALWLTHPISLSLDGVFRPTSRSSTDRVLHILFVWSFSGST